MLSVPLPSRQITSVHGALASLALSVLLSSLATSIANVALPTLAQAFAASFQDVQWVVLAYLLSMTTLIVSVGRIGDLVGRKRMFVAGLGTFAVASGLCAVAPTLGALIAARALQGLGAAGMMALALALAGTVTPKANVGGVMGLLGTMSAIGTALGPSLGGLLIHTLGWPAIFLLVVPFALTAMILAARFLPRDDVSATEKRAGFDGVGTLLLALTLGAYALAMTSGRGSFGSVNVMLLGAAVVGVGLFVISQIKAKAPLIQISMLRAPHLRAGLVGSLLVATVMMATLIVGPFYLSSSLGLDERFIGIVMSAGPFIAALAGVPAGRIVERYGSTAASLAGLAGIGAGSIALAAIPATLSVAGYMGAVGTMTAFYALFQAANNTGLMAAASAAERGVISGMLNLARNHGLITGASVMGAIFAAAAGASPQGAGAASTGLQVTFAVAAGLIVIAALLVAFSAAQRLEKQAH